MAYDDHQMTEVYPLRDINHNLKEIHAQVYGHTYKKSGEPPIIGISANHRGDENLLTDTYPESVRRSGGIPMIIPYGTNADTIIEATKKCDALIMSGGGDIHPAWFGAQPSPKLGTIYSQKDYYDFLVIQTALRYDIPVLAICRGHQMVAVMLGGDLIQDIPSECKEPMSHDQNAYRYELWHDIDIHPEGRLKSILEGVDHLKVNSFHHQAVKRVPSCGTVCAASKDGIIEGIDYYPEHNILGVQWHPEALACYGKEPHHLLFDFIVREGALYAETKALHKEMIGLDSHTDTPMVFSPYGPDATPLADYDLRDRSSKALVDLPKMNDGKMDAVVMVAYLPQKGLTEEETREAYDYTERTLDAIDDVVDRSAGTAVIARTAQEVREAKANGVKAIIKGIENSFGLGEDLSNVAHFAEKGVRYITLCHNGDNYVCDSASKSAHTHGGLSDFGKTFVLELEKHGIMIDLAHTGSDTIRDVLAIATGPVIASHSSCRALCDHPRNLTDDELRGIAATGGVVQICMYHGFLRKDADDVSILHFIDHICHAVSIIGAEHVGIGTDFDGDGEVIGCRDASQFHRITTELLRRGLNKEQIKGIAGENFLRVMEEVERRKEH